MAKPPEPAGPPRRRRSARRAQGPPQPIALQPSDAGPGSGGEEPAPDTQNTEAQSSDTQSSDTLSLDKSSKQGVRLERAERKRPRKPRRAATEATAAATAAAIVTSAAPPADGDQSSTAQPKDERRSRHRVRGHQGNQPADAAGTPDSHVRHSDNHVEPDQPASSPAEPHHVQPPPMRSRDPENVPRSARERRNELSERALRGLVTTRGTQVSWSAALRARDVASPTAADMAEAERDLVIVRRNYTPPEPLPASRKVAPEQRQERPTRRGDRQRHTGKGF